MSSSLTGCPRSKRGDKANNGLSQWAAALQGDRRTVADAIEEHFDGRFVLVRNRRVKQIFAILAERNVPSIDPQILRIEQGDLGLDLADALATDRVSAGIDDRQQLDEGGVVQADLHAAHRIR